MFMSRFRIIFLLSMLTVLAISGCGEVKKEDKEITVMTYNVYFGGDTGSVFALTNLQEVPVQVAKLYAQFEAAAFEQRVKSVARFIKENKPHLVGLQEMVLIRRQSPGNFITGTRAPDAEDPIWDFRGILKEELEREGLNYEIVAEVQNIDAEMPMFVMGKTPLFDDVRMTVFDVVLARSDVGGSISREETRNYKTVLDNPLGISVTRGYVALDVTVSGTKYRLINTHLEAFRPSIRLAQARELVDILKDEKIPLILLGDFNSDANAVEGDANRKVYELLLSEGYKDVWEGGPDTGSTCCQDSDLRNKTSKLNKRIDHIFVRNVTLSSTTMTKTVGDKPTDRITSATKATIWPSDHAGVITRLSIK